MKRFLVLAALCVIVAPALGSPEIGPVMKIKGYTTIGYDLATGQTYPLSGLSPRWGRVQYWTVDRWWFANYRTEPGDERYLCVLDWGDLGTPGTGFSIGGCYVMVLGHQAVPTPGGDLAITWLAEENGYNSTSRIPWARLKLINMPGFPYAPPGWAWGWNFALDFQMMGWHWTLDGNDLDGDGLVDFGYSYWFIDMPAGTTDAGITIGPFYHPMLPGDGGAEDVMDLFGDPNYLTYYGTYWIGGPGAQFTQFRQQTYAWTCPDAGTTPPGVLDYCWTDIYPPGPNADCIVNISDLGVLLTNYNQPGEYTYFDGDVYPTLGAGIFHPLAHFPGDGVVDISDLGQMLAQYGDDCNGSP